MNKRFVHADESQNCWVGTGGSLTSKGSNKLLLIYMNITYIPNNPLCCCLQVNKQKKRSWKMNLNRLCCSNESCGKLISQTTCWLWPRRPLLLLPFSSIWAQPGFSRPTLPSSHFWSEDLPAHLPHSLSLSNEPPWGVVPPEEEECHIVLWISPFL